MFIQSIYLHCKKQKKGSLEYSRYFLFGGRCLEKTREGKRTNVANFLPPCTFLHFSCSRGLCSMKCHFRFFSARYLNHSSTPPLGTGKLLRQQKKWVGEDHQPATCEDKASGSVRQLVSSPLCTFVAMKEKNTNTHTHSHPGPPAVRQTDCRPELLFCVWDVYRSCDLADISLIIHTVSF